MDAKQLKCGNLVSYKWFQIYYVENKKRTVIHREVVEILAVDSINNRVLIKPKETRNNHTWRSVGSISPVVLSESWLLDIFKFEISGDDGYTCDYSLGFFCLCSGVNREGLDYFIEDVTGVSVTSVHQLQNLYSEMSGKELKYESL